MVDVFTKEQAEAIGKMLHDLRKESEKGLADSISAEVMKKMETVLTGKLKEQRQASMEFDVAELNLDANGQTEYGKRFKFLGDFIKACEVNDGRCVKTTMTEGDNAQGGYLVPTEQANEIIKLITDNTIIKKLARILPMKTLVRTFPTQLTAPTLTWTGEHTFKTPSKPTFGQLTQTANKLAVVVKLTDELIADETVGVQAFLREIIAQAFATEYDNQALVGNGAPFTGVLFAAGVAAVTMAGANLIGDDIIDLFQAVPAKSRVKGTLVTSTDGETLMFKLKDANGQYLWSPPTQGNPARIWGKPYEVSDQILSNYGGGANQTAMMFGDWKNLLFSPRSTLELLVSRHASDWVGGALESAFMQDETWSRWMQRISIDVANAAGFSRIYVK